MNILYLSHLSGSSYAGPTYSVPKQVEYQSKIDNVFWYNAVKQSIDEWKSYDFYHDLSDFPNESIKELPSPFDSPDLIVVELFYNMGFSPLIVELMRSKIPYVLIPRGELTHQAQKRKKIKKKIANTFLFKKYAKRASAIQYLTQQEYLDSGNQWNNNHIIIPNGIETNNYKFKNTNTNSIKCISIGRIEPYQKGIDLLIRACSTIKDQLNDKNCTIDIYGPDIENKIVELESELLKHNLGSIIKFHDGVYGEYKKDVLLNSDVFLITSRFEGHPMALIEALSFGLPVITTKGSNMNDEVERYNAGWTADNSIQSIREAILNMLEEYSVSNKSKNAIELSKNYTWNSIAELSGMEYRKIIDNIY